MKATIVKTSFVLLAVLLLTSANSLAQDNNTTLDSSVYSKIINRAALLNNFQASLRSDVKGIVEGTIYNIVVFKRYFPEENYSKVIDNLSTVMEKNGDPSISYKAQLALMYLRHANTIEITPKLHAVEHEYIFKEISQKLEKNLLVINN